MNSIPGKCIESGTRNGIKYVIYQESGYKYDLYNGYWFVKFKTHNKGRMTRFSTSSPSLENTKRSLFKSIDESAKANPLPFGLTPYQAAMSAVGLVATGATVYYVYKQSQKPAALPVTTVGGNGTAGGGGVPPIVPGKTWVKQTVSPWAVQPGTSLLVSMYDTGSATANASVASSFTNLGLVVMGTWSGTQPVPYFWPSDDQTSGRIRYYLVFPSTTPASITLNLSLVAMTVYVLK